MNDYQDVLEWACAIAGIDAKGTRLLRIGSNAVCRLKAPIIARVSRPGADADHVRRTVAVARWLKSAGYPAVRPVDVDQPVVTDRHVAVVSPIVFVVVGSLTIASPVVFYLTGGHRTKMQLDSAKDWLAVHNGAVMTVLVLVLGVNLDPPGGPRNKEIADDNRSGRARGRPRRRI